MKAQGKVTSVSDNTATVVSKRNSACASCSNCENKGMCHAELIFSGENSDAVEISVLNPVGAKVGDTVEIEASSRKTLFVSAVVFILPIILTVLFAFVVNKFVKSVILLWAISVLFFLSGFVLLTKLMNIYTKREVISSIVKILEESDDSFERK